MSVSEPLEYNPFAPGYTDDPYPHYQRFRDADPVHHSPMGVWLLFRHQDVTRFLREPGLSVEDRNAHDTPLTEVVVDTLGEREQRGANAMINRDPPDHTRLRRLVSKAFTPRMVQRFRDRVQELVDRSLDAAADRGGMELIDDYAFPLPFQVITDMLGLPDTGVDVDEIRDLSGKLVGSLEPVIDPERIRQTRQAGNRMFELIAEAVEVKRHHPGDDLLSGLILAEEDGDVLGVDELIDQVVLLYVAGHETTVNLVGNGVRALLLDPSGPEQLARLRAGQAADDNGADRADSGDGGNGGRGATIENAVDELLRFDSPVQMTRRITLRAVEVDGHTIEPGAFVSLVLASANRDPAVFGPTADRIDIGRDGAAQHVSFGGGHHYCLGASLARLEAQVALGSLFARFDRIEPLAEPVWNGRINLRGLERLPLQLG